MFQVISVCLLVILTFCRIMTVTKLTLTTKYTVINTLLRILLYYKSSIVIMYDFDILG